MSDSNPKNEKLEKLLEENKNDPEATAILSSKWMQRLMAEVEEQDKDSNSV